MEKTITFLFYLVFFLVPIVLWPYSFELFEFNKMITVYLLTLLIVSAWIIKSILKKKIIFSRTILDIPLIIFLGTQLFSTMISVDSRTSFLGFYSRFNGGFLSTVSFSLLYWAFISNLDQKKAFNCIKSLLISALLVCLYGILEHFGIDKHIWVQDVSERVFSTLGQPNWLAAWTTALIPLTWAFILKNKKNKILFFGLSIIIFLTLLYTKSRSGFLGFAISSLIFWTGSLFLSIGKKTDQADKKNTIKIFVFLNLIFLVINLFTKTPWTPDLSKILNKKSSSVTALEAKPQGTVLETGGTESATIRKYVWMGAIDVWKRYPILGSGVETFAFSFYQSRPKEHNLVSEWDFLYNKAHNEYLNFLATTGALGFVSYLLLIGFIIGIFIKLIIKKDKQSIFSLALLSGFISILITNFFGFSVVAVNIQFFLYPAIALSLSVEEKEDNQNKKEMTFNQKALITTVVITALFLIVCIIRYWLADLNFAKAKIFNDSGRYVEAREYLLKAIKYSPKEAIIRSEFSENCADIAKALYDKEDIKNSEIFIQTAIEEASVAEKLSPNNLSVLRQVSTIYIKLSMIDNSYLIKIKEYLEKLILLSPNDARLYFNLGLFYENTGNTAIAIETLQKAIDLKANYKQARSNIANLYLKENMSSQAKQELEYILKFIDPNDESIRERLSKIKN